jgi:hypothetical protein
VNEHDSTAGPTPVAFCGIHRHICESQLSSMMGFQVEKGLRSSIPYSILKQLFRGNGWGRLKDLLYQIYSSSLRNFFMPSTIRVIAIAIGNMLPHIQGCNVTFLSPSRVANFEFAR